MRKHWGRGGRGATLSPVASCSPSPLRTGQKPLPQLLGASSSSLEVEGVFRVLQRAVASHPEAQGSQLGCQDPSAPGPAVSQGLCHPTTGQKRGRRKAIGTQAAMSQGQPGPAPSKKRETQAQRPALKETGILQHPGHKFAPRSLFTPAFFKSILCLTPGPHR